MSLFQLYETERKPFKVGKKWICVDPGSIGFPGGAIEIIKNYENRVKYKVLTERYQGAEYESLKIHIQRAYEPYTES